MNKTTKEILNKLIETAGNLKDLQNMLLSVTILENETDAEGYRSCPLCNSPISHVEFSSGEDNLFYIECKDCKLKMEAISKGEDNYTKEYLKHKWNRRTGKWDYEL